MFTDTHCHLDDAVFTDTDGIIEDCEKADVGILINAGSDIKSSESSRFLSEKYPSVYYCVGIHPENAGEFTDASLVSLKNLVGEKCVAIGEIGLDYHYPPVDREKQEIAFIKQIELANALKLPVVVHSRDAHADTLKVIKENKPLYGGTMHCFSGSRDIAREYLDMGFCLSFGGTITFKNASKIVDVLKFTPFDRMLTETDSPYLSPDPFRGKRNSPANIPVICEKIASVKNVTLYDIEIATEASARKLFTKLK